MQVLARLLHPDGLAILEVGLGQAEMVAHLGGVAGLRLVSMRADLGGIARAVLLEPARAGDR